MITIENADKVSASFDRVMDIEKMQAAMEKAALKVEAAAKHNIKHSQTGTLRSSIQSEVKKENDVVIGEVGSTLSYAPYVEYGTGLFSEQKIGRKDVPWRYQDDRGKWHTTCGQHPQPFLIPALDDNREEILSILKEALSFD